MKSCGQLKQDLIIDNRMIMFDSSIEILLEMATDQKMKKKE